MKGNGNSRYLKTVGEALSLYPTYEDFLQAMIEGTFPVDFNGINKDGWTQQGTPLNKANLLSDTVISTLGLSTGANSTPNDAFNVLANIGNVHVWRKTVVTEEGIPAGYKLGATITKATIFRGATSSYYFAAKAHATISVLDDGTPVVSGSNSGGQMGTISSVIADDGEFIYLEEISSSNGGNNLLIKPWLVKSVGGRSSLRFNVNTGNIECTGSFAQVTTYPSTPPGTHITYLTSTNRNAYQEGADGSEKPAGYTLGAVKTGKKALSDLSNYIYSVTWQYGDSVAVSDDGKVSIKNPTQISISATNDSEIEKAKVILGKFATPMSNCGFEYGKIYFFPSDSQISREPLPIYDTTTTNIDKHQEVTGYPAIPAGTTIEYLGVLGEFGGASLGHIKYGSYVGTGTGTVTIPFKNKPLIGFLNADVTMFTDTNWVVPTGSSGISNYVGSATWSGGKLTLSKGSYSQFPNSSGETYKYVAFLEGE